jgi:glycosyltransferase involved in cell wall biosynthesis
MKTSVLIIARNEEAHMGKCVESLLVQTKRPGEIVLIAHNSTDKTKEIAKEFPIKIFELSGKPGIVNARLEGLDKVSGDIILCIDGDSFASPNWIEEMGKTLLEGNILVSSFVKMKGNIFAIFSNIFNRLKFRKAKNVSRWIWGPSFGFWSKDKDFIKKVLKESETLSSKLGLSRNPDDLWLALFMQNKGKIALTDRTFVTQNTKEKSIISAINRNRENMKNGNKIEKYFNNKPNNNMFLYHKRKADMQGDILYPLNTLKEIHPEISTEIVKKYDGREWLLNTKNS